MKESTIKSSTGQLLSRRSRKNVEAANKAIVLSMRTHIIGSLTKAHEHKERDNIEIVVDSIACLNGVGLWAVYESYIRDCSIE